MIWIMGLISLGVTLLLLRPLVRKSLGAGSIGPMLDDGDDNVSQKDEIHQNAETSHDEAVTSIDKDIEEYKRRLDDLERDVARGLIRPEDAKVARAEISRQLLRAKRQAENAPAESVKSRQGRNNKLIHLTTFGAVAALPLLAGGLYLAIGTPGYKDQPLKARNVNPGVSQTDIASSSGGSASSQPPSAPANIGEPSDAQVKILIAQLEERLAENPQEVDGWALLARAYEAFEKPEQAERAWKSLLEVEPTNQDGLWFAGVAAARGGRPEEARQYWVSLQSQYNQGTQDYDLLEQALNTLP